MSFSVRGCSLTRPAVTLRRVCSRGEEEGKRGGRGMGGGDGGVVVVAGRSIVGV